MRLAPVTQAVGLDRLGAHPLLTDVVVLLGQARDKLSDWVDVQPTACAAGVHYENDGQGRDFDFCPDCGVKL